MPFKVDIETNEIFDAVVAQNPKSITARWLQLTYDRGEKNNSGSGMIEVAQLLNHFNFRTYSRLSKSAESHYPLVLDAEADRPINGLHRAPRLTADQKQDLITAIQEVNPKAGKRTAGTWGMITSYVTAVTMLIAGAGMEYKKMIQQNEEHAANAASADAKEHKRVKDAESKMVHADVKYHGYLNKEQNNGRDTRFDTNRYNNAETLEADMKEGQILLQQKQQAAQELQEIMQTGDKAAMQRFLDRGDAIGSPYASGGTAFAAALACVVALAMGIREFNNPRMKLREAAIKNLSEACDEIDLTIDDIAHTKINAARA